MGNSCSFNPKSKSVTVNTLSSAKLPGTTAQSCLLALVSGLVSATSTQKTQRKHTQNSERLWKGDSVLYPNQDTTTLGHQATEGKAI